MKSCRAQSLQKLPNFCVALRIFFSLYRFYVLIFPKRSFVGHYLRALLRCDVMKLNVDCEIWKFGKFRHSELYYICDDPILNCIFNSIKISIPNIILIFSLNKLDFPYNSVRLLNEFSASDSPSTYALIFTEKIRKSTIANSINVQNHAI